MDALMRSLRKIPPTTATVSEAVDRIFASRQITCADQQVFLNALLSEHSLTPNEQVLINQVLDALRKGSIQVVD